MEASQSEEIVRLRAAARASASVALARANVLLGSAAPWSLRMAQVEAVQRLLTAGCSRDDIRSLLASCNMLDAALIEHDARTDFTFERLAVRYGWLGLSVEKQHMLRSLIRCAHTAIVGPGLEDQVHNRARRADRRFREFAIALANAYFLAFDRRATVTSGIGVAEGKYTGRFYNFTLECAALLFSEAGAEWKMLHRDWGQMLRNALRESDLRRPAKPAKRRGRPPKIKS